MTERFNKAYNALINAYHNDTLAKGTCLACAVGNIIADARNIKLEKNSSERVMPISNNIDELDIKVQAISFWSRAFMTDSSGNQTIFSNTISSSVFKELTGYTGYELSKIENVFEKNAKLFYGDYFRHTQKEILEDQFNGLSAVIDVMLELDNEVPITEYHEKMKNHPKLELCKQ